MATKIFRFYDSDDHIIEIGESMETVVRRLKVHDSIKDVIKRLECQRSLLNMLNRHVVYDNENDSRIIVISDIHGGVDLTKRLLEKIQLISDDILVILGDFVQRGYENEKTFHWIKSLTERPKTFVLSGNHEHYLCSLLEEEHLDRLDYHMTHIHYGCLIREWIQTSLIGYESLQELQGKIKSHHQESLDFLSRLPYSLKIGKYLFVHAGIKKNLLSSSVWDILSNSEFYLKEHEFEGLVVVGHWPVQNYKAHSMSGDVLYDFDRRIISIDGGYGVKTSGQINALLITDTIQSVSIDDLETYTLRDDVKGVNHAIEKLDYLDKDFTLIEYRDDFSMVRKKSNGHEFLLINDYLKEDFEDYISYFISGKKGDVVKLIHKCKNFSLVKSIGEIGWIQNSVLFDVKK